MELFTGPATPTAASSSSSPLSPSALTTAPLQRRRTSACDDLARLHFTPAMRKMLLDDIAVAVEDVLESMLDDATAVAFWKPKMRKDNVVYYEDKATVRHGESRFCCVNVSEARVEDVMQLFALSDSDTLLQQCRIMYNNVVQAQVLSVLEYPSTDRPFRSVFVRYTAFETPKVMRNHRDMLVVVSTDVIQYPDGSTVGYCVWDSLNLQELTDFDVPPGFTRSRMFRSGFFVQNTGKLNALTKVAYVVGIEAGGFAPRLASRFVMPRFGAVLNRVCSHIRKKRLNPTTFVPPSEWTDKRSVQFCQCCRQHFGAHKSFRSSRLFDNRTNCFACGDVICHGCTQHEEINVPGAKRTRIALCIACLSRTGKKPTRLGRHSSSNASIPESSASSEPYESY